MKAKRTIEEKKTYLHRNGLDTRKVMDVNETTVWYSEGYGGRQGSCGIAHFKQICPKEATLEDEKRERVYYDKWARVFPQTVKLVDVACCYKENVLLYTFADKFWDRKMSPRSLTRAIIFALNKKDAPMDYDPFESLVDLGWYEENNDILNVRWNAETKQYEDLAI